MVHHLLFSPDIRTRAQAPLLFHHLLDLAENMESSGLAAHAAASLAVCELVARLCLGPERALPVPKEDISVDHSKPEVTAAVPKEAKAKKGKGKKEVGAKGITKGEQQQTKGQQDNLGSNGQRGNEEVFPALALACLKRSRLLLKLGTT